jgi:hypothetical protein
MPGQCIAMLVVGVVLFCVGGLARVYMNALIARSALASSRLYWTEARYTRLIRERGAKVWPLVVVVTCIPLGMLLGFAAIICANYAAK